MPLASAAVQEPVAVNPVVTVPPEFTTIVSPVCELREPADPSHPLLPTSKLPSRPTSWPAPLTPLKFNPNTVPAAIWGVVTGPATTPCDRVPLLSNCSTGEG